VVYNPFNPGLQLAGRVSNVVYRRNSTELDTFIPSVAGVTAQQIRAVASKYPGSRARRRQRVVRRHPGPFLSPNNGASCEAANGRLEADQFRARVVAPNNGDVIYAGGRVDPKPDESDPRGGQRWVVQETCPGWNP